MKWSVTLICAFVLAAACKDSSELDRDAGSTPSGDDAGALCGNGQLDGDETCDGDCPTCDDDNACTIDTAAGAPETCDVSCSHSAITTCASGDGCCPDGCTFSDDTDCMPPTSAPLPDRLVVSDITTPAGVKAGDNNWRIWGTSSLGVAPVFTVPLPDCGTLVGYTTTTNNVHTARVARLNAQDELVTTYDLGTFVLRGLAAEPDGYWAALLWKLDADKNKNQLHVRRYSPAFQEMFSTAIPNDVVAPDDFNIGESRLEYSPNNSRYAAYFHVHGITQFTGHEGDMLRWIDKTTGAIVTGGWTWGCSHSTSNLLRFSPAANLTLPICATDCFPGTVPDGSMMPFANTSIGGIYLNHDERKVRDFNAGCNGSVAVELGGAAPGAAGWKLVFNGHQNAAALGQSSYNTQTMNQDIGFQAISNTKTLSGSIVWLTSTSGVNEANASIARWQPAGDATEQYIVGWTSAPTGGTYYLSRVNATGGFLEGPTAITSAKWGRRDDPFRTHANGDVVWAWFDSASSSTLRFARLRSGNVCTP